MKSAIIILVAVVLAGCSMHTPSEKTGYKLAAESFKSAKDIPAGAELLPIDNAELYIDKNAGYVVLHYTKNGESKDNASGRYVVRLKRVSRTWKLEKRVR